MPTRPAKHRPRGHPAVTRRGWSADGRGSRQARGYGADWDKLRKVILERDKWLCRPCIISGRVTAAQAVDHIKPKAMGGGDDPENLQSICNACHSAKTQRDRRGEGQSL
jgi:5-methylcytosine-specific restriction protein A